MNPTNRLAWLKFYPEDFRGGTSAMTTEQIGAYILLLCEQWSAGSIPVDEKLIRRIARVERKCDLGPVIAKFPEVDGVRKNLRMEEVRQSVQVSRNRCANNGRKGGRPKQNATQPTTETEPKENPWVSGGLPTANPEAKPSQNILESDTDIIHQTTTRTLGEGGGVVVVNGAASPGNPDRSGDTASGSEANPPVAADPADDPEVAAALGQGAVVPDDAEVHAWAKAWPGFPALGIPAAIDPAWLDRRLAWYASRRNPFPADWRRDIELAYRADWQSGRIKPSPKNGGPPSPDAAVDPASLPKAARKLPSDDQRYVLTIRQKAPMLWQRRDEIEVWREKVEMMTGGSRDGTPAHKRAKLVLEALEEP